MDRKQGAIDAGYVNFGYFAPEVSSNEEYPEYIREEVEQAICKIKSYQNSQSVTFGFMTDIHYSKTPVHDLRAKRLFSAYKEIKESVSMDMLILGGDYVNNGTKSYVTGGWAGLREHLDNITYFPVNGNHDDNSFWDAYVENKTAVNHLTTKELYNLFYNHLPKKGANIAGEDKLYYFYDDEKASVRYIFLDTNDIPTVYTETGALKYTKQHCFGISQAQIDWLVNIALKTKENTDIILCAHNVFFPSYDEKSEEELSGNARYREGKQICFLNDILDAYHKKTTICKEFGEGIFKVRIEADFSDYSGDIICVLAGHHHKDIIEKSHSGINFIYSDCTAMYQYGTSRSDGDVSELIFNIVTVDRLNRKIYITRVGAGEDKTIPW